jgi:hypothetical protein
MILATILSLDYDKLNPINKYNMLKADAKHELTQVIDFSYTENLGEIILLTLYTIDFILKKEGGARYNYYILGDLSVRNLIEKSFNIPLDYKSFMNHLILIDEAKLTYRFTCAKKFLMPDDSIKQLRLNSWGREYIKEYDLLNVYADAYNALRDTFTRYFRENQETYSSIMNHLLTTFDPDNSISVQSLNEKLDIKLLS